MIHLCIVTASKQDFFDFYDIQNHVIIAMRHLIRLFNTQPFFSIHYVEFSQSLISELIRPFRHLLSNACTPQDFLESSNVSFIVLSRIRNYFSLH